MLMSAQTSRVLMNCAQEEVCSVSEDLRADKQLIEVTAQDVRKSKQKVNMSERLTKISEKLKIFRSEVLMMMSLVDERC